MARQRTIASIVMVISPLHNKSHRIAHDQAGTVVLPLYHDIATIELEIPCLITVVYGRNVGYF